MAVAYDDVVHCEFNRVLTELDVAEIQRLLGPTPGYGFLVNSNVVIPTEHLFQFDGILTYHVFQDGTTLAYNTDTSTADWPPMSGPNPWRQETPQDVVTYAAIPKGDPRRIEGYNLNKFPARIRQELETAFGNTFDSRMAWFDKLFDPMTPPAVRDARIAQLTNPLPVTTPGSVTARRCFASQPAVNSAHASRIVREAKLGYTNTGGSIPVGRSGSLLPGDPVSAGPVSTLNTLAEQISRQPIGFRFFIDGLYGTRWQETSVTVTYNPNWPASPPMNPPSAQPWEPAFFDADFSLATLVEVDAVVANVPYSLVVNAGVVTHPSGPSPTVESIITGLVVEWNNSSAPADIKRFVAVAQQLDTQMRLLPASVPLLQNHMRYPVTATGSTGPLLVTFPALMPDERLTTWNYDWNPADNNAISYAPSSDAFDPAKYRSPYFDFLLDGYDNTQVYAQGMEQRVREYWYKGGTSPTGSLAVSIPAPLPVPQWYLAGHEEEMTFIDLARNLETPPLGDTKNAFKFSFNTMQTDARFQDEVRAFLPFDLGFWSATNNDSWEWWIRGSASDDVNTDCREALWNSFAFRKTGEIIGLAYTATAMAFDDANHYPLNGIHYRHQYKCHWTYPAHCSFRIMTSPWDWGDVAATHQGPPVYGDLTPQWEWIRVDNQGTITRPGGDQPLSLLNGANLITSTPNPDPDQLQETGYTAFAQHYAGVVSAAAASRKPIVAYLSQSIFNSSGASIPQLGSLLGTPYWNELILHCVMQAEHPNPLYFYNTDNVGSDSQTFAEQLLVDLLEELDIVLDTGQVIPHIPRPFRYQDPYVLTRVDARGKFLSRLTPHAMVFQVPGSPTIAFNQQPDYLQVTITYPNGSSGNPVYPPQNLTFQTGRLLVQGDPFLPTEFADRGYWIEQTRLYQIPGPEAWEFKQPDVPRKRRRHVE